MSKNSFSLTAKIAVLMSSMVAIILVGVIAIVGSKLNQDLRASLRAENEQIATARAAEIGRYLDSFYWQLRLLSVQDILVNGDKVKGEDYLQKSMAKDVSSDTNTALLVWADGQARTPAGTYVNIADRGYFKSIFADKKDYAIGEVAISKSINQPTVMLAKSITGTNGVTKGFVAFEIKMDTVSAVAASMKTGETGYGWIVDQRGLVIAYPAKEAILALDITNADKDGYKGLDTLGKKMLASDSGDGSFTKKDGTRMATYFSKIPNSPGWVLGISITEKELLAPVSGMLKLLYLILAISVLVAIAISVVIARSIVKPIKLFVQALDLLAKGDLALTALDYPATRQVVARGDELGTLGRSVDSLIESLTDIVTNIQASSGQVSAGSQQLSTTSQQMSQGATEQAASVEEISSSMEQMTSNIKQNAENALMTEKIAQKSAMDAENGGKAVTRTVEAMKVIASKTTIIEEIARSTNMLALNASIEAARAGEYGKGFAVVASEVGKLAERSQKEAGEISKLSAESVQIAENAGETINRMIPDIKRTSELVQEISASSSEQNSGAEQINSAILQLDQVVQQNASASEESASMSEELAAQAEQMQTTISFFKTGEDARQPQKVAAAREHTVHVAHATHMVKKNGIRIALDDETTHSPVHDAVDQDFKEY